MLTDAKIRQTKPRSKPYRRADGHGLCIEITPAGGKLWRYRYRFPKGGKEKLLSLGKYPVVSLAVARERHEHARALLEEGVDPSVARQIEKQQFAEVKASKGHAFEAVAREWLARQTATWSPGYAERVVRNFERDVFPWIGDRPVSEITSPELLEVLRQVESYGVQSGPTST